MRIMRVLALVAAAVVTGPAALASTELRQVAVCIESIADSAIDYQARIASSVFADIGVELQWHDVLKCPEEAIHISFSRDTPANAHPGALAYAKPYDGSHIVVFLDRVRDITGCAGGRLLGYTLAHEIAHVLEGMVRHSRSGLMKAQWGPDEHYQMIVGRLGFAAEDVDLIYRGLEQREARLVSSAPRAAAHQDR